MKWRRMYCVPFHEAAVKVLATVPDASIERNGPITLAIVTFFAFTLVCRCSTCKQPRSPGRSLQIEVKEAVVACSTFWESKPIVVDSLFCCQYFPFKQSIGQLLAICLLLFSLRVVWRVVFFLNADRSSRSSAPLINRIFVAVREVILGRAEWIRAIKTPPCFNGP